MGSYVYFMTACTGLPMTARHTREMKCAKQLMGGFTNKGTLELTPSYEVKI